jgi:hypothetical protein
MNLLDFLLTILAAKFQVMIGTVSKVIYAG